MATPTAPYTDDGLLYFPDASAGDNLYYAVDWSSWLSSEGDTLTGVTWTVASGLTSADDHLIGNKSLIKLSSPTAGTYKISCKLDSIEAGKTQTKVQVVYLKVV